MRTTNEKSQSKQIRLSGAAYAAVRKVKATLDAALDAALERNAEACRNPALAKRSVTLSEAVEHACTTWIAADARTDME